jgi:hypothetical protein
LGAGNVVEVLADTLAATHTAVMLRESGASSTPPPPDSSRAASGILDRPPEPVIGLAEGETRWRAMTA